MTLHFVPLALIAGLASVAGGCATHDPLPYREVVTMKAGEASATSGYPPPGTVWRLDESDMRALSPAPIVDGPPPPRRPPPPVYYPPPPPPPVWPYPY